ncbi:MAG: hypothetical protein AAFQ60_00425 [Pseudomonadota bacterium]
MSDTAPRRISTLRLLKRMHDLELAQVSQQYQQRQTDANALRQEMDALEKRIDHEIENADAGAAAYLEMFLRAAQRRAAHQRVSHARVEDAARLSEAELQAVYQRVTALRLTADVIAANEAAAIIQTQQAQALESMITQHDRRTRDRG